jgi:hypothetical protein
MTGASDGEQGALETQEAPSVKEPQGNRLLRAHDLPLAVRSWPVRGRRWCRSVSCRRRRLSVQRGGTRPGCRRSHQPRTPVKLRVRTVTGRHRVLAAGRVAGRAPRSRWCFRRVAPRPRRPSPVSEMSSPISDGHAGRSRSRTVVPPVMRTTSVMCQDSMVGAEGDRDQGG